LEMFLPDESDSNGDDMHRLVNSSCEQFK
jgi:hypothetical protein